MKRLRSRLGPAFGSTGVLLSMALVGAIAQQPGAGVDPERAFSFGDANLDGKLSLDEFKDLLNRGAQLKKATPKRDPAMIEPIFWRLDADRDGSLSLKEYRQVQRLRPGGGMGPLARKAAAREKPTAPGSKTKAEAEEKTVTPEQVKFFESKIRPVLMTKCAGCHGKDAEKVKGGLRVDSRDGLRVGGDSGAAIVPGRPDESLLISAIRHEDDALKMPPKAKLPGSVIADFEEWVRMGAPDPRTEAASSPRAMDVDKARRSWAFQPPRPAEPPPVEDRSWPRSEIDRFVLAGLEAAGLKPVGDAGKNALIRRASFDLIGLPPTPGEVEAFVADDSPDAFAKVVDRLLASPRFGERWGRHWLDVARFAESSGKANMLYPQAWRYRDWVIASFNRDRPFDEFVERQVAGDLLASGDDRSRADSEIATGFLAVGPKTHNTQNRRQFLVDLADEQIDATSQAFLGLTVACARCHDHKFDPISQKDYHALSGIFQSTDTRYGTLPGLIQNANPSALIELPAEAGLPSAAPRLSAERRSILEKQLADLVAARDALTPEENFTPKGFQTRTRLAILRFRLDSFRADGTPRSYAMGAREKDEPVDSPLYARGELEHPGEPVPRGLIPILSASTPPEILEGSGRRELASWLASRENPLTARVMVNRVWLHLFGRGLVASPDNFGAAGLPPSHPGLLDSLAVSFMDDGWSIKRLIRRIALSHAYQLASTHDPRGMEVDPDNTLIWRMSPRRLEAEAIRDAILAVAGTLRLDTPVGSAAALAGEGPAGPARGFHQEGEHDHRAIYLPVVRDQLPESLALFDFADPGLVNGDRSTTSGPSQSLYLLNSPFVIRQSKAASALIGGVSGDDEAKIRAAYLRFLARSPTASEIGRAREFLASSPAAEPASAAWAAFCQALYAGAEFRYLD